MPRDRGSRTTGRRARRDAVTIDRAAGYPGRSDAPSAPRPTVPPHRALRLDDVSNGPDGTALRITHERIDVPEPFAALLLELVDRRPNTNTATNATSRWLFPGMNTGQHGTENSLRADVRNLGIELLAARNAALRQLVLDCPPAVVASLLNYSYGTIDRHAAESGSRWKSYASERTHSR